MANDKPNTDLQAHEIVNFCTQMVRLKAKLNVAQKALLRMANPTNGDELRSFPETIAQQAIDEISQI